MSLSQRLGAGRGLCLPAPSRVGVAASRRHAASAFTLAARRQSKRKTALLVVCRAVSTTAQTDFADTPSEVDSPDPIDWAKGWYPVGILAYLDKVVPIATRILGGRFVLWHSEADGQWHCHQDLCPHRLAPLSEGKVVGNTLQCSYHGWRFCGDGTLAALPQGTPDQVAMAQKNPRSCVTSFPVREQLGLLWVWPDAGESRWIEAAATPVAKHFPPEKTKEDAWWSPLPLFRRDHPYSWRTFFDNILDPAHLPWSHHGVIADRDQAQPFAIDMVTSGLPKDELEGIHVVDGQGGTFLGTDKRITTRLRFIAPHTLRAEQVRDDGTKAHVSSYVTPTRPGRCAVFAFVKDTRRDLVNRIMAMTPTWMCHLIFLKAGDGDSVLLKSQEQLLPHTEHGWREFYLPTKADSMVARFNSWMDKYTSEEKHPYMLTPPDDPPQAQATKEQLLDRWDQHVSMCSHCQKAMRNFERLRTAATAMAVAATAVATLLGLGVLRPSPPPLVPASGIAIGSLVHFSSQQVLFAVTAAAAGLFMAMRRFFNLMVAKFHFEDYVHAYM